MSNLIIFKHGLSKVPVMSFVVETADVAFGDPVETATAGKVKVSDAYQDTIGHLLPDDGYEALSGSTSVAIGDFAMVALKGSVVRMNAGSVISVGDLLILDSTSRVTNIYVSGTTDAADLVGIALTAGGSSIIPDRIEVVRF